MMRKSNKLSVNNLGFIFTSFFIFTLLPVLVSFFNIGDSELSPLEFTIIGLIICCLLTFFYFSNNYLFGIAEPIKTFFVAFALCIFALTVFFPSEPGMLDGLKKDYNHIDLSLDLLKYMMILAGTWGFVIHEKTKKIAKSVLIGCGIVGLVFVIYACAYGQLYGHETKKALWTTFEDDQRDLYAYEELASDKNIIIILWDGMEGKIAEEAISGNYERNTIFDGFIFYPNAIASAPLTWRSLPMIYSGKYQFHQSPSFEVIRKTMYSDSFFIDAKNNGYKIACKGLKPTITIGGFNNFKEFNSYNDRMSGNCLVKYIEFFQASQKRITPLIIQRFFSQFINLLRIRKIRGKDLRVKMVADTIDHKYKIADKDYYKKRLEKEISITKLRKSDFKKKLFYFHSIVTHEPYITESGAGYSHEHAKAVFKYILLDASKEFLNQLKKLGLYDSSLIFIISDHGAKAPEASMGIPVNENDWDLSFTGLSRYPIGTYNPLLMVKKPFQNGPMKTVKSPAMLTDIREIITKYVSGDDIETEKLFNLDGIENRDIQLIVVTDPKVGKDLDMHISIRFTGSMQNIHKQFKPDRY